MRTLDIIRVWPSFVGVKRKGWRFGIGLWRWCIRVWFALLLTSCASSPPRVIETPPVCPAAPDVPAEANVQLPEFLPVLKQPLPDAESASELLRVRVDSAAQYQSCRGAYEALRGWVLRHSR